MKAMAMPDFKDTRSTEKQPATFAQHATAIVAGVLTVTGLAFLVFPGLEQPLLIKLWLGALLLALNTAVIAGALRLPRGKGKITEAQLGLLLLAIIAAGLDYAVMMR